jgi:Tol biopolymer transport system component
MIDTFASPGVQLLEVFGPALLVTGLGVVAFLVLDVLYVVALFLWLAAEGRQTRPRGVFLASLCLAAVASGLAARPLAAQVAGDEAPVARTQPRFTRIFGSDSMEIGNPALSPDGRWIVFSRQHGRDTFHLWVVPASGGTPIQLTSGRHVDGAARWFPSGDRIAFASDRPSPPGEQQFYVMTIPFDARTGRSSGAAQQVSLEEASMPVVSPDGRWIAFGAGEGRLLVVPSAGGTARTVARVDGSAGRQEWSPDGRELYFAAYVSGSTGFRLMRVSADSGPVQTLWSTPRRFLALSTTTRQVLTRPEASPSFSTPVAEISTFEGRHVASLPLHRNMAPRSFAADGHSILATVSDDVAPIRVVPVAGGPSITLTQARESDELDAWTADAGRLAVRTRLNGHATLLDVPIDGGEAAEIATPPEATRTMLSSDRKHLFYVVSDSVIDRMSLRVRRLGDGRTREIARDLVTPTQFTGGPGGRGQWPFSGEEILYTERRGDRFELRACAPEGQPHVLRSFPLKYAADVVGVHGERVAFADVLGDSTALLVAEGPNGAPRRVAVVPGGGRTLGEPVWSPDGRWIAASYNPPDEGSRYAVFIVGVTPADQPNAPPRLVPGGPLWGSSIKWLPDSRAVTVWGMNQGYKTGIWLVSLREGELPINLTRDDPSSMYSYSLSPDGRYIAYPAEIPRGSSLWRIDLQP